MSGEEEKLKHVSLQTTRSFELCITSHLMRIKRKWNRTVPNMEIGENLDIRVGFAQGLTELGQFVKC